MFYDKYELFLRTKGYLEYASSELAMDGGPKAMDVVSGLVMEEIEQGGLHDIHELVKIMLELVELKNEGKKNKCACALLFVLLLVMWIALK
jgi:hypothetical protein